MPQHAKDNVIGSGLMLIPVPYKSGASHGRTLGQSCGQSDLVSKRGLILQESTLSGISKGALYRPGCLQAPLVNEQRVQQVEAQEREPVVLHASWQLLEHHALDAGQLLLLQGGVEAHHLQNRKGLSGLAPGAKIGLRTKESSMLSMLSS